ncbi:F-box protein At5g07610-like [Cornus florida]|uniref:F-box protein At5g07610-like n=1 Tax=Cornus florida TaxID=4283 RepID=UPI00289E91B9|nr:F-box protein At5g07610-like [Cornus florida]
MPPEWEDTVDKISSPTATAAAELIGGNEDLVVEILRLLPAKSLIGMTSVSKTCNINGNGGKSQSSLVLVPDMPTTIRHSCNGFLVCSDLHSGNYVYHPTTKQFFIIPRSLLFRTSVSVVHLLLYMAFDPVKSLHYKVVLLDTPPNLVSKLYQIYIYSSATNAWRKPVGHHGPFSAPVGLGINNGVYCNGSIHWFSFWPEENSIYFDVDQERFFPMPSPPYQVPHKFRHFGESRGHLYLTEYYDSKDSKFSVHVSQMESDYSKWSLKYQVDLNNMVDFVWQDMIVPDLVSVLSLIHGKDEGDVFLVLLVGTNMIISYNVKHNTFKKLHNVAHSDELLWFKNCDVHSDTETLFPI